mmetsp:Transcript_68078/g.121259  ORF Transcript_68078/g.121259 Transcript_68078/m.121259 type:complete len:200 (-) Transcript_68078:26-625(-)
MATATLCKTGSRARQLSVVLAVVVQHNHKHSYTQSHTHKRQCPDQWRTVRRSFETCRLLVCFLPSQLFDFRLIRYGLPVLPRCNFMCGSGIISFRKRPRGKLCIVGSDPFTKVQLKETLTCAAAASCFYFAGVNQILACGDARQEARRGAGGDGQHQRCKRPGSLPKAHCNTGPVACVRQVRLGRCAGISILRLVHQAA